MTKIRVVILVRSVYSVSPGARPIWDAEKVSFQKGVSYGHESDRECWHRAGTSTPIGFGRAAQDVRRPDGAC